MPSDYGLVGHDLQLAVTHRLRVTEVRPSGSHLRRQPVPDTSVTQVGGSGVDFAVDVEGVGIHRPAGPARDVQIPSSPFVVPKALAPVGEFAGHRHLCRGVSRNVTVRSAFTSGEHLRRRCPPPIAAAWPVGSAGPAERAAVSRQGMDT